MFLFLPFPSIFAFSSKDNSKEEKRLADLARKQEAARLLAEEEKAIASKAPKAAAKPKVAAKSKVEKKKKEAEVNVVPAGPGAIAAGGGLGAATEWPEKDQEPVPVSRDVSPRIILHPKSGDSN